MPNDAFKDIERLEARLWHAADDLRANSKLTSSDYFMPVVGVIFPRHAANRFEAAQRQIEADRAGGKMPRRKVRPADYFARRSLYLHEHSRYDWILQQASVGGQDLPTLVNQAMSAIEAEFEPLSAVLPKDYGIFEPKVLGDLMRTFDGEQIRRATGDFFGRIYEYFLAEFSMQKAHDNGEFFTPSSLVELIVRVIEPEHGKVFDPACGSGGIFVQSSHFIEHEGGDPAKRVAFYGQEKNGTTIRIAKMNLAVHGLEGTIAEAITYYEDAHELAGKCDFVMANPPFNADLVDAVRIQGDKRLPFGLPGVDKQKKVGNGNYLWISYFWSYLNERGRAGFVMSSQASGAGHGEKEVRRKIVETGDVDVMISIRSNFFYTRTVAAALAPFERAPVHPRGRIEAPAKNAGKQRQVDAKERKALADASSELLETAALYEADAKKLLAGLAAFGKQRERRVPETNEVQRVAREGFDPLAESLRGLVRQVDLLHKLAARCAETAIDLAADEALSTSYDRRGMGRLVKQLDEERGAAVEQLKHASCFHRRVAWLQDRFPEAELQPVPGLVELVSRAEIEASDWSLTPGRCVGVAPPEEHQDFDFEQTLRDIHAELAELNEDAVELEAKIQENFEGLGI